MLIRGVSAIIFNDKNQVLLILRDDMPAWNLVGGGVDEGETFEEGLIRETMEEACVEIDIVRQCGHYFNISRKGNKIEVKSYVCKIKNGKAKLGNEGVCLQYFDLDKLPKNLFAKHIGRIQDAVNSNKLVKRIQDKNQTVELLNSLKKDEFLGWDYWIKHPRVLRQIQNKTIRFDVKKFDK